MHTPNSEIQMPAAGRRHTATAKALDYSLKRWTALTQFLDDGQLPIDNNWIENQIRPIAIGRNNWMFVGSLRAGQRAAAVMSLIQSAKLNGHPGSSVVCPQPRRRPMKSTIFALEIAIL
jgi:hypothetical protein